jgi:hypothetical protein
MIRRGEGSMVYGELALLNINLTPFVLSVGINLCFGWGLYCAVLLFGGAVGIGRGDDR